MMNRFIFLCLASGAFIHAEFRLGIENIPDSFITTLSPNKPLCIGLITNQTGKDQTGKRNIDILQERGIVIKFLCAPEHGISGTAHAAKTIKDGRDHQTKIPIISLYKNGTGTQLHEKYLPEIDALFFDIQDSGMRHYTYISTLFYAIEYAAYHNKPIVILDRPNPLGIVMEGPLVEPPLKSFISIAEIPLRHGMTVGELAYFFNVYAVKKKARLYIVPMKDYDRNHGIGSTLSTALSPNITCADACYGYSFLGLLGEIKPFNVGIGTPLAFQIITLPEHIHIPKQTWQQVQNHLATQGIESSPFHYYHQKNKKSYRGLRIHVSNINTVTSFPALLAILTELKQAGLAITFSESFDKAIGTSKVREYLTGALSYQELAATINEHLELFIQRAQRTFYYKPYPSIKML